MKYPKYIKIGGHKYRIIFKKKFRDPTSKGMVVFGKHILFLNSKMDDQETEFVFWHEILHIIDKIYNAQSLNEKTICRLSEGLFQTLKDNKFLDNLKERE